MFSAQIHLFVNGGTTITNQNAGRTAVTARSPMRLFGAFGSIFRIPDFRRHVVYRRDYLSRQTASILGSFLPLVERAQSWPL
jgi:hypothetical protein